MTPQQDSWDYSMPLPTVHEWLYNNYYLSSIHYIIIYIYLRACIYIYIIYVYM